jgi:UDP-glucose 4-epimerase
MTKRVLVTGGTGFIGAALCHELAENGYEVSIFDIRKAKPNRFHQTIGDIRDAAAVRRAVDSCETVFHLAGLVGTCYLGTRASEAIDVNVHGAVNVFEAAKASGAFVVNVGLNPEWLNAYMISKKAAMRFGLMYFQMFDTRIVTVELTHVYGPGQPTGPYRKAIPTFIVKSLRNEPIQVYGSGERMMDCVFVDDAARALRLAAERPDIAGKVARVSSGTRISVLDLAYKIREFAGSTSEIQLAPMRPGEPAEISATEAIEPEPHAKTLLGWEPEIEFDKGLQNTIDWYGSSLGIAGVASRTRRNLAIERSLVEV